MRSRSFTPLLLLAGAAKVAAQQPSATPGAADPVNPYGWEPAPASCIAEIRGRALAGAWVSQSDMTIAKCIASCDARNFVLAGLQYSSECHCAPFLCQGASLTQVTGCRMPCSGRPDTICGGSDRISLYVSTSPRAKRLRPDYKSAITVIPDGWSDEGCMVDSASARILGQSSTNGNMNIDKCTGFCAMFGYPYAGQDSTQIYHNPSLAPFNPSATTYTYRGCIQDPTTHALTEAAFTSLGMSIDMCTAFCANGQYRYAGLSLGRECRCGNTFQNGAGFDKPSTACTLTCTAARNARCGGQGAMSIYELQYGAVTRRGLKRKRKAALNRMVATGISF